MTVQRVGTVFAMEWNTVRGWLNSWSVADDNIRELTAQFYITLRAYFARIQPEGETRSPAAYARVAELLDPARPQHSWSDCYEAEQLLVHLFDDDMLETELRARLVESANLRPPLPEHYATAVAEAKTSAAKRTILLRLVNDLQWRYTVNEGKRRFAGQLTSRSSLMFFLALLAYASLLWWASYRRPMSYNDIRLALVAGATGAWGATFSMLTSLQTRIEASEIYDLRRMRTFLMLISRALIGGGAAAIFYFFFLSGLVSGPIFPTLTAAEGGDGGSLAAVTAACPGDMAGCLPMRQFALLVVWCFLAGFSEKLVPSLLARTEQRADSEPPERFRPTSSGDAANGGGAGTTARSKPDTEKGSSSGTTGSESG